MFRPGDLTALPFRSGASRHFHASLRSSSSFNRERELKGTTHKADSVYHICSGFMKRRNSISGILTGIVGSTLQLIHIRTDFVYRGNIGSVVRISVAAKKKALSVV